MADQFDISEHIKVEALGTRDGSVVGSSLYVNNKVYNVADYSTTPITVPITDVTLNNKNNSLGITWGTANNEWADGVVQYPVTHPTGTVTYELWYIERPDNSFIGSEDPATLGTMHQSWTKSATGGVATRTIDTLNPGTNWYLFGVYYISGSTKILVGKALASRFMTAAYTYAFTGSIGSPGSTPGWRATGYTSDLATIRSARTTHIVPRDASNGNVPRSYSLYFNGTLAATFTLSTPNEYWNPDPSSLATWTWSVGTNTLKLFLATDNPLTATPRSQLTVNFGYTSGYNFPTYEVPVDVLRYSGTEAMIRWDFDEVHIDQVLNPANIWADTYIDVFGSDGTSKFYRVPVTDINDAPIVNSGDRVWQSIVTGLNMDSVSYLFKVYFLNESTMVKTLWHTATYGPTPPSGAFTGEPVRATGWWPIQCSVANVEIEAGYNVDKGMLKTPEVGTCSLTMKGAEADPRVNTALQLDNKIRVKLAAAASPDASEDYLFAGFIDNLSTSYDTYGNSTTTLGAVDSMSRVLNVNIPIFEYASAESFSTRMFNIFEDYIAPATWGVSYDTSTYLIFDDYDRSAFPPEYRENVSASEVINELTEGESAVLVQNRGGVIFWFNRSVPALIYAANEDMLTEPNWYGFSTEHNASSLDHFCISDFVIENRMEDITNKVVASLSYDELTTATYSDTASIDYYGERAYQVQLNVDAPSADPELYLQRWIEEVPYFEDRSELQSLTTSVINRHGLVTRAYQKDATIDPIRVFIQTGPVDINGIWFAKKIRHSITPENWVMSLDLTAD